jgi:hypothetical protein
MTAQIVLPEKTEADLQFQLESPESLLVAPLLPMFHQVTVKACKGGRITTLGTVSLNLLHRTPKLEVEPATLTEQLSQYPMTVTPIPETTGELSRFTDKLTALEADTLHFDLHVPVRLDDIEEIVLWVGEDPEAGLVPAYVPPPPTPLICLEELPRYFIKTCLVSYRNEAGDLRTFTDVLHSYVGSFAYFFHHLPIPVHNLMHVSPLETQSEFPESGYTGNALPLWDLEPVNRSIP